MIKSKNSKGFTLVELIIVITILAILASIWFTSFQGFSADARDTKRKSELGQIRDAMQVASVKWSAYVDMIWSWTSNVPANINLMWFSSLAVWSISTWYKVWNINSNILGIDNTKFTDKYFNNDYILAWVSTWHLATYQIAATLENYSAWWKIAYIIWDYSPRSNTWGAAASWSFITPNKFVFSSNLWIFNPGDMVIWIWAWSVQWGISNLSADLRTVTIWGTGGSWSTLKLANSESASLIYSTWWSAVVQDWTVLPY